MSRSVSFVLILLAATFLMGSSFVAGKILVASGYPPMVLVGWRFLAAAVCTLPLVAIYEGSLARALFPRGLGASDAALVAVIGLFQTAGVMSLLFYSMRTISASSAAILLFTNPIWVALLGRIFLGEALHGARIVGLLLGIAGVVLAIGVGPGAFAGDGAQIGELTGLASAFCWSISTIINKRARLRIGTWALSFWQMLIGSLVVLAIAYAMGQHWPEVTTRANWAWFFYLSVPASTGSFGLWFVALSQGGATRTSSYLFLAPLFAVISSFIVLDTTLTWLQALGGALIGLAVWLVNRELPRPSSRECAQTALAEGEP
jgi:drug/metabolite transporter (DMT)-like permease